jgi:light-regulated signal transduction histidine kinase (bacteriophytochrome)
MITNCLKNHFFILCTPDDIAVTLQEIEKLQNGAITTSFINRYRKKDGTYLWFEWNTTPNKATGRLYAIARDITERKKFEEQLINTNQELESFSYSVSHDLRAPLRAVNGYAQILKEEFGSTMDKEAKRLTERIMYSAQKMGQLIDDLLTFSRLSRKELVKTTIEMNKLVAALCMEIRNQYPAKNIQFNIKNLHDSEADPVTIKQVWINLINNAVKYSRHNDNILIEIGSAENDNYISYYISDNGVGFDMQYYDKLFGVFQRLHSENEFEGTGVGLAIVKRIISKHDGIVRAEGKLNKGATFYFTLPK